MFDVRERYSIAGKKLCDRVSLEFVQFHHWLAVVAVFFRDKDIELPSCTALNKVLLWQCCRRVDVRSAGPNQSAGFQDRELGVKNQYLRRFRMLPSDDDQDGWDWRFSQSGWGTTVSRRSLGASGTAVPTWLGEAA
jgi:hypothetical protein